jgi:hypothetical protein
VAAHAASGGMLPDLATTVVITTLLSGAAIALADRRRGLWFILGVLGLDQLVLHLFLELAGSHEYAMSHGRFDDLTMLAGHSAAALSDGTHAGSGGVRNLHDRECAQPDPAPETDSVAGGDIGASGVYLRGPGMP